MRIAGAPGGTGGFAPLPAPRGGSCAALGCLRKRGSLPATERAVARPEEPYGRRRVAPRGVTGTPPAGERRGLVPARPANAAVAGPVSAGCGQAKAAPGLPPARAGLSVRAVVCHAAGGQSPPHPPLSLRSEVGRVVFLPEWLCAGACVSPGSSFPLRQVLLAGSCSEDDPMAYIWPLLFFLLKGHAR